MFKESGQTNDKDCCLRRFLEEPLGRCEVGIKHGFIVEGKKNHQNINIILNVPHRIVEMHPGQLGIITEQFLAWLLQEMRLE